METTTLDMSALKRIKYLKHYMGKSCIVTNPQNLMSGEIESIDIEDDSVLVKTGEMSHWVGAEWVKPNCKTFAQLDNDDLKTIINNIIVNNVTQNESDFTVTQRTETVIVLHSEKFNMVIKKNWGILLTGVEGSIASTIDNTGQIILLLCELNYDITGTFE